MSSTLVLVLASAALHSGWNLTLKRNQDPPAATTAVIALTGVLAWAAALAEWATGLGVPFGDGGAFALSLGCGLSEAAYFICLARALRDAPLGVAYVVARGGSILLLWPLCLAAYGERASLLQGAGVAAMLLGLVRLYPVGAAPGLERAGYGWAVATALFTATNHVLYKGALLAGARPWGTFALAMLVAAPVNLVSLPGPDRLGRMRRAALEAPWALLWASVQCAASLGLALFAMRLAGAAWVGTLRNVSVAVTPLLGWLVLGERPGRRAFLGFVLTVAAVVLLAL
ncbi:MAG: EamA family transporter [Candidatus Riflebacteria bacterium]|nr:EamA family transporter [Candidatus Riflebacteria bacterium]